MAAGDPYVSIDILKEELDIDPDSTDQDDKATRAVTGATAAIDNRTGWGYPGFWKTASATARTLDLDGNVTVSRRSGAQLLLGTGIASATGLQVAGYPSASLRPSDCFDRQRPATSIRLGSWAPATGQLVVTAFWGWPDLPDDVVNACLMQATRYFRRSGSPEGVAGSAEWGLVRIPYLDPDVRAIVDHYRRPGVG